MQCFAKSAFLILTSLTMSCVSPLALAGQVIHVYETNQPAARIAPLLKEELQEGDTLTVYQNKLVIKTSTEHHLNIQSIIDQVDRVPRNLLISVRRSDQYVSFADEDDVSYGDSEEGVRVNGPSGNQVMVYRGSSSDGRIEMRKVSRNQLSTDKQQAVHQVRTVEGEQAFIATGEQIPYTSSNYSAGPVSGHRHPGTALQRNGQALTHDSSELNSESEGAIASTTRYQAVTSGIYVKATLQKDKVRLELQSRNQQANDGHRTIETAELDTVLTIPTGIWMPIGGVSNSAAAPPGSVTYSTRNTRSQDYGYEVRVDALSD